MFKLQRKTDEYAVVACAQTRDVVLTMLQSPHARRAPDAPADDWLAATSAFSQKYGAARLERLCTMFLRGDEGVVSVQETAWGCEKSIVFPIRAIVAHALTENCDGIVLIHNHPSGDPRPSRADIDVTRRLARVLSPLNITLTDHVITSHGRQFSFRAAGLL